MAHPKNHRLTTSTLCRHTGAPCHAGIGLITRLSAAMAQIDGVRLDFTLSGQADLADCSRDCTVAWHATAAEIWFKGDINSAAAPAAFGRIEALGTRLQ